MNINEFCKKAISVPFKTRGRSFSAWDCWGLVYVAFKEIFDYELPTYTKGYHTLKDRDKLYELFETGREEEWYRVEDVKPGDIVMLYISGRPTHIGLMISKDRFIHCDHGAETTIERLSDFRYEGIYRHNSRK